MLKTEGLGDILDVQTSFCVVCGVDCASTEKWLKREGFVAFSKTMAGVGNLKRMHFSWQAQYKRHLQQRCSELKELIS